VPIVEDAPLRETLYPYRAHAEGPEHRLYHYDKVLVERTVMGDPALPGTVLRLPMIYGPRDRQHRTWEYLKRMDDMRRAIVLDEGMARWRWTKGYVEDVASAVVLAVTDERAAGRIYNVGEWEVQTWAGWVRAIGRVAGWTGEVVTVPRDRLPEGMVPEHDTDQMLVTDTARIRGELGYAEQVPQDEALRRTVAWERANPPEEWSPFDYAAEDAVLEALERGD
jgi:nucleoside-diphosphate-sugar epimerase